MKKSSTTEMELFSRALELPPDQRATFLQEACAGDSAVLRRIERLLEGHAVADALLPDGSLTGNVSESAEQPGTMIGRYKLLEQIGEGGFGVVYVAEQQEPVRRRVALKIIKLGMDTRQVIARFEAERQALAMMDHPNIAKVLDAGATETGRPYFVMELVRGIPITQFCDKSHQSLRQRIKLLIPVCHAIQHAHQKGVIHRDLKPSNILVTLDDGVAHPMVIDFGVAKAISHRLTEKTLYTNFAQMIGTPAYMSPEQAEMSKQDVDTRSDVYSLGVLLYELLTGTTPFAEERLREAGYAGIQRIISEEEPERPSTRVSTMHGEALAALAKNRESQPEALQRFVKGDLDWIVMKAMEKDRTRRYGAASELAADLERHLLDEPVLASSPSALYRWSKFVRRHRTSVAAGVTVALTVVIGASVAMWQAVRATRAEAQTQQEADTALQLFGFFRDDLLAVADPFSGGPNRARDRGLPLLTAVDLASRRVNDRFPDRPLIEAGIHAALWKIYFALSEHSQAEAHITRALELYEAKVEPRDLRLLEAKQARA